MLNKLSEADDLVFVPESPSFTHVWKYVNPLSLFSSDEYDDLDDPTPYIEANRWINSRLTSEPGGKLTPEQQNALKYHFIQRYVRLPKSVGGRKVDRAQTAYRHVLHYADADKPSRLPTRPVLLTREDFVKWSASPEMQEKLIKNLEGWANYYRRARYTLPVDASGFSNNLREKLPRLKSRRIKTYDANGIPTPAALKRLYEVDPYSGYLYTAAGYYPTGDKVVYYPDFEYKPKHRAATTGTVDVDIPRSLTRNPDTVNRELADYFLFDSYTDNDGKAVSFPAPGRRLARQLYDTAVRNGKPLVKPLVTPGVVSEDTKSRPSEIESHVTREYMDLGKQQNADY